VSSSRYLRRTARVLVTHGGDHCLLFRFSPEGIAPFWFTPGGECEPEEDFPEAARRELFEETGICADPAPLRRVMEYDYTMPGGIDAHAIEHWFHHHAENRTIDISGHTELERQSMTQHRWFTRAELGEWHETVYPYDLVRLIERVTEGADR
jgi:8-oxo-dGTP pyrophosphatase MutT (NUDIX family)